MAMNGDSVPDGTDEPEVMEAPAPTAEELGLDLPDDPEAAIEALLRELDGSLRESAEQRDGHLRALAEMDNVRKRSVRDRVTFIQQATEGLMRKLLPVLDSFDAALVSAAGTDAERQLLAGLRQTYDQLWDVLGSEGLTPIDAEGDAFDPSLHEAISATGEGDALVVVHQVRRGFRLRDRVLRPATVVVGPSSQEVAEDA